MRWNEMKCCWDEDKKEYYEIVSTGNNDYMCLGCYEDVEEDEYEVE